MTPGSLVPPSNRGGDRCRTGGAGDNKDAELGVFGPVGAASGVADHDVAAPSRWFLRGLPVGRAYRWWNHGGPRGAVVR